MTNFLDTIFNPWLGPLLKLPPFWTILIISAGITLLITIVYKYTTNQEEMKRIKEDLKKYQKEMRKEKDTKKLMAIQKKALDLNMKYMMSSFKSTLYTFIPIIIIFAWLNMHIAYYPLYPDQEFTVTAKFAEGAKGNISLSTVPELYIDEKTKEVKGSEVNWVLKGKAGEYKLVFDYNNEEYQHNILITEERSYLVPEKPIRDSKLKQIIVGNKKVHPFGETFNIFGWYPGWLATYIILSLVFSTLFRKLLKVY
ncbi:MAG: EMC3/TMCO1 family protein [Candidatus Woesearchaeota archaeon]